MPSCDCRRKLRPLTVESQFRCWTTRCSTRKTLRTFQGTCTRHLRMMMIKELGARGKRDRTRNQTEWKSKSPKSSRCLLRPRASKWDRLNKGLNQTKKWKESRKTTSRSWGGPFRNSSEEWPTTTRKECSSWFSTWHRNKGATKSPQKPSTPRPTSPCLISPLTNWSR